MAVLFRSLAILFIGMTISVSAAAQDDLDALRRRLAEVEAEQAKSQGLIEALRSEIEALGAKSKAERPAEQPAAESRDAVTDVPVVAETQASLSVDDRTGVIDLVIHPSEPNTLYAATWQRVRKRWNDPRNEEGYEGGGIYKSTDAGRTWDAINAGLPEKRWRGRIGIDIARSAPDTLYAFIDNYEPAGGAEGRDAYGRARTARIKGAEVYRTDNGGQQWRKASESNQYMAGLSATYGWVFGQCRVDPNDPETVYIMGLGCNKGSPPVISTNLPP